jgi:ectoine hydroxylase-related dioxygenase (phytanoyl-CoA dioxygenase family)
MNDKRFNLEKDNFDKMANFFYDNGYVILENALSKELVEKLSFELNLAEENFKKTQTEKELKKLEKNNRHRVHKCFFENSPTTVDVIENSKLMDFAQHIIGDVPGNRPGSNSLTAHVIHNNAFIIQPGGRGQAPSWHVDDPLQQVIVPNNYTLPPNIRLPILNATYMIWLSDCDTPDKGPTYIVPGSHRFGRPVSNYEADKYGIPACGKAGTAVLVNANVWHRGCENKSNVPRETLQITVGRRIIGHKFKSIMNYQMPEHVLKGRSDILKQRLGFLEGGAYS